MLKKKQVSAKVKVYHFKPTGYLQRVLRGKVERLADCFVVAAGLRGAWRKLGKHCGITAMGVLKKSYDMVDVKTTHTWGFFGITVIV